MSIIRNSRSTSSEQTTDNSRRIKRFLKSEEFLAGCGHWPRYWVGLNNKYLKQATTPWGKLSLGLGDTVVVKCEIAQDAVGPILGAAGSDSIKIIKEGSNIKWYKGTTALRTEAWSDGIHLYGFFNSSNGMYPYYDRDVSGTKITACNTRSLFIGRLSADSALGDGTGDCIYSTTQTYAIKVYEVVGVLTYAYSSATEKRITHYYAATTSISGTTPRMFETRYHSGAFYLEVGDGSAVSGVTAVAGLGDFPDLFSEINKKQSGYSSKNPQSLGWYEYNGSAFVPSTDTAVNQSKTYYDKGYGIQLLDLTDMFGGPYKDLVGMVCADNAQQAISAADAAEVLVNGNETRELAFRVAGGSTSPSSPIPLPTGWSVQNRPSSIVRSYIKGELIYGRMPRWSIWADAIKFGFYVDDSGNIAIMRFNYLKENDGSDIVSQEFDLIKFDGYNEAEIHVPVMDVFPGNTLTIEYHNTVACTIDEDKQITGQGADEARTFFYSQDIGDSPATVRIGNLAPWNYKKDEFNTAGMSLLEVYGGGVAFYQSDVLIASMIEITDETYEDPQHGTLPMPLCADSNSTVKNKFRVNGFSSASFFHRTITEYLMHQFLNGSNSITLKAVAVLSSAASENPASNEIIDCSRLVPSKTMTASGVFNNRISSSSTMPSSAYKYGDRFIVGEHNGKVGDLGYDVYLGNPSSKTTQVPHMSVEITPGGTNVGVTKSYGNAIATCFGIVNPNSTPNPNTPVNLFSNDTPQFVAFLVATACGVYSSATNTAVKERFVSMAKIFRNNISTTDYVGYAIPFRTVENPAAWWASKKLYSHNFTNNDGGNDTVAAAFFMWQDLIYPGKARGSSGKADVQNYSPAVEDYSSFPRRFKYVSTGSSPDTPAPVTAHVRFYSIADKPRCWEVYFQNRLWSEQCACPFIEISHIQYYFHFDPDGNQLILGAANKECVNAYFSIYDDNTGQKKLIVSASDMATALNGRKVYLYYQNACEPQEERVVTGPIIFDISGLSSSVVHKDGIVGKQGGSNTDFSLSIDTTTPAPFWTTVKTGTGQQYTYDVPWFARINIVNNGGSFDFNSKIFFINII